MADAPRLPTEATTTSAGVRYDATQAGGGTWRVTAQQGSRVLWASQASHDVCAFELSLDVDGAVLRFTVTGEHNRGGGIVTDVFVFDLATGKRRD